jgi:predicted DNA-binding protein (MmcQ/YjbR family)
MDAESLRRYLLSLPHVEETVQWGGALVFWVAEKSIGGKIFSVMRLEPEDGPILSFVAGPEKFSELLEIEGIIPAPYFARAHWVALEHWRVLRPVELQSLLAAAHDLVFAKLAAHTRAVLAMPPAEQKKLIAIRKKALAARSTASKKTAAKKPPKPKKK